MTKEHRLMVLKKTIEMTKERVIGK